MTVKNVKYTFGRAGLAPGHMVAVALIDGARPRGRSAHETIPGAEKKQRGPTSEQRAALYEAAVWRGRDHGGHRIRSFTSKRFLPSRYRTRSNNYLHQRGTDERRPSDDTCTTKRTP